MRWPAQGVGPHSSLLREGEAEGLHYSQIKHTLTSPHPKAPFRKGVARRSRDGGLPAHSLYRNISNRGCSGAAIPTALRAEPLSKGAFWEESWRFQRRWPKEPYLKTDPAIVEFFTNCDTLKNIFVTGVTFAKIYGIINNSMGF